MPHSTTRQVMMTVMGMTAAAASADLTWVAAELGTRRDIVVTCIRDDEQPAGQFVFGRAEIVMNLPRLLDADEPPEGNQWWLKHARLMGVLVHELGHAHHTPRRQVPQHLRAWVNLLEEPRIEAAMLSSHIDTPTWLRSSALSSLIVQEPESAADAAETIILTVGRNAAGILTDADIADVIAPAERIFTAPQLHTLRIHIRRAATAADDDLDSILASAAGIAALVDEASGQTGLQPSGVDDHTLTDADLPDHTAVADAGPTHTLPPSPQGSAVTCRDAGLRDTHARMVTPIKPVSSTTRGPTAAERTRAQQIGSWLTGPSTSRLTRLDIPHSSPPGRMRTQEVMRGEAQHDLGVEVTAKPWSRTRVLDEPSASCDVAVIIDRSLSMRAHLDDAAGAAWVLDRALRSSGTGRACTWVFSDFAEVLPTGRPDEVVVPQEGSGSCGLAAALADFSRWSSSDRRVPRVLAVVSDGALRGAPVAPLLAEIEADGTHTLWCAPTPMSLQRSAVHYTSRTHTMELGRDDLIQALLAATSSTSSTSRV
jgi:hypothetical protein